MPIIETDFARALREADERQAAKLAQTTDQNQASKRHSNGRPKIPVTKPVVSYRRSVLRSVLDEHVGTFGKDIPPIVRRRTVHVAPVAVQTAEQDQRTLEGKLSYQAGKIGSAWSKWINEARPGGWKNPGSQITDSWMALMESTGSLEADRRLAIITAVGSGMGLAGDFITNSTPVNDNKIAYVKNALSDRRHLLIGVGDLPIGPGRINSGAFFVVSVGHLSRVEPESETVRILRASLMEQHESKGALGIEDTYLAVGNWVGRTQSPT